jgi:hypothetical protein
MWQRLQRSEKDWLSVRALAARKKFDYASLMWALRVDRGRRFLVWGGDRGDHLISSADQSTMLVVIFDEEE